jgi:hypothetical protein
MTLPIACKLTPEQLRDRGASLLPGLVTRADAITPVGEGYRLTFSGQDATILSAIAACAEAERRCCPFLAFDISVAPEVGPIILVVSGPTGTQAFLKTLLSQ